MCGPDDESLVSRTGPGDCGMKSSWHGSWACRRQRSVCSDIVAPRARRSELNFEQRRSAVPLAPSAPRASRLRRRAHRTRAWRRSSCRTGPRVGSCSMAANRHPPHLAGLGPIPRRSRSQAHPFGMTAGGTRVTTFGRSSRSPDSAPTCRARSRRRRPDPSCNHRRDTTVSGETLRSIATPQRLDTRLGTLELIDGAPTLRPPSACTTTSTSSTAVASTAPGHGVPAGELKPARPRAR